MNKVDVDCVLKHDFLLFSLQEMAINSYDIVSTLQALGMMKYWKGKHIILKKQVRCAPPKQFRQKLSGVFSNRQRAELLRRNMRNLRNIMFRLIQFLVGPL
jgi:hypothetical protein